MAQLRLALGQVNPTVGDLVANADLIVHWVRRAAEQGAHVVMLPEMALPGYPVEDLALRGSFVEASRVTVQALARRLADAGLGGVVVVVGYLDSLPEKAFRVGSPAGAAINAAGVLYGGEVVARYAKHQLPNYGVFDEHRYFVPGDELALIRIHGIDVAVAICEDLWQDGGPVAATAAAGAGLLLVINASPYELGKDDARLELVGKRAVEAGCSVAYVNLVGGQDGLVDADGILVARAPRFEEACLLVDLELPAAPRMPVRVPDTDMVIRRSMISEKPVAAYPPVESDIAATLAIEEEVYKAVVTGLRDFARKNGFTSAVLGLSGGIDSALVAAIAADALGPSHVYGVSMPGEYSSEHSMTDAADLARRIGLHYDVIPIAARVDAFQSDMKLTGLAEENLQARVRGVILMGLGDKAGHLVLTTGNKSEMSTGFSTMYGDAAGRFAPIMDVPKTMVWRLARWRNQAASERGEIPPIPENSITKPPSAELAPNQFDGDILPEYAVLDDIVHDYVERYMGLAEIVAVGFDPALIERMLEMVDVAEYQRQQYPPGPKITPRALGKDRRLPITNRWRETAASLASAPTVEPVSVDPGAGAG
jgi:NAD+ synthase (glutamine-hydrolysing)